MRTDKPLFKDVELNTMSWIIENAKRNNQDTSYIYLLPDYYDNLKVCVYMERCLLRDIEIQNKQAIIEKTAINDKDLQKINAWIENWLKENS